MRGCQHARRAKAALQGVMLSKSLLQCRELIAFGEALDRPHLSPICLDGKHQAAADGSAVNDYGARAAYTMLAANVGPRELQMVS
jgi:hypothetical protein